MKLSDVLDQADESALQDMLGRSSVRLLGALEGGVTSTENLRTILSSVHSDQEILLSKHLRREVINLLRQPQAEALCSHLGLSSAGNPWQNLHTTAFPKNSKRQRALFEFFDVSVPKLSPPKEVIAFSELVPGYGLFDHQRMALTQVRDMLDGLDRRGVLHMPTGAGKTRTTMTFICEFLRRQEPALVVWLANTEELCQQAAEEFEKAWHHLGNRSVGIWRAWGGVKLDPKAPSDGIVVAGLQTAHRALEQDYLWAAKLGDRTRLVVMDEAHQAIAPSYARVLNGLADKQPGTRLLGLTATPGRSYLDMSKDEKLADFFCRNKVTLAVEGYPDPVSFLVDQGYLAKPTFRWLSVVGGRATLSDKQRECLERSLDIPTGILKNLADDEIRSAQIVAEVKSMTKRHARILLFATTVEHAQRLAAVLDSQGVPTRCVHGGTDKAVRRDHICWYKTQNEEPRILVNYGVLTTGFDAPQTSATLIARPTKSLVLYSQMVGRAIRGIQAGGNAEAEIVTVVDPILPGFGDLSQAFTNWEDVW